MQREARLLPLLALLFAATSIASAKNKDAPPTIVEVRDVPMQKLYFEDNKPPRDCNGGPMLPGRACLMMRPVAWQAFNKTQRGISLVIDLWGDKMSGVDAMSFTTAAVTIAVDENVIELPAQDLPWDLDGSGGRSSAIENESLLRMIAAGSEVWVTVHAGTRVSQKLSPKTLESIKAVLKVYDSLN
jgi:hypothetical protein